MAKFLILGGAGFIGSNFAKYVIEKGHSAVVVDNFSTGDSDNFDYIGDSEKLEVYRFRLQEEDTGYYCYRLCPTQADVARKHLETLISETDYIIHLAGSVGVQYVEDNPKHTILNNLEMEQKVFEWNEKHQKPIFFASTSEVYGDGFTRTESQMDDFRETDTLTIGSPTQTRWGYACSKLMGEFLLHSYTQPFVIGRFFNVTGRNQMSEYGMVVPTFVEKALHNEPITVYGGGTAVRCFCHVDDAVRAMYKLMLKPKCYRQIFNIGNPVGTCIYDLGVKVRDHTMIKFEIQFDGVTRNVTDIKRRVPNIDKLVSYIDWKPEKNLDDIIRDTIDYQRQ